jgi:hypothetical protein
MLVKHNSNLMVKGSVSIYNGLASNIKFDSENNIISYDFAKNDILFKANNVICNGYFQLLASGYTLPCAIAIGNGDNGTINGTGGIVNPSNAPQSTNILLNKELTRFPCLGLQNRVNTTSGVITFNALYPRNAYSGRVTEVGLFAVPTGSVAGNSINSGYLVARRATDFTKTSTEDVQIVWTIQIVLS